VARLKSGDDEGRVKAAGELADMGTRALPAARALCEAATDRSARVAHAALEALEKVAPDLQEPVFLLLVDEKVENHQKALSKLSSLADRARPAEPVLFHQLAQYRDLLTAYRSRDLAVLVIPLAMQALAKIAPDDPQVVKSLGDLASLSLTEPVRVYSAGNRWAKTPFRDEGLRLLGEVGEARPEQRKQIVPLLVAFLREAAGRTASDEDSEVLIAMGEVESVGNALVKCGPEAKQALSKEVLPRLKELKFHRSEEVRRSAAELSRKVEEVSR
jgi:hypothetical protein